MPSDWFSDTEASQWGYYSARLRAAARLAPSKDVVYGGYIVSRTTISDSRPSCQHGSNDRANRCRAPVDSYRMGCS